MKQSERFLENAENYAQLTRIGSTYALTLPAGGSGVARIGGRTRLVGCRCLASAYLPNDHEPKTSAS
jgi:hypothetical protein